MLVGSSFRHLHAPRSTLDSGVAVLASLLLPWGQIGPGHSGLLLYPRDAPRPWPGGAPPALTAWPLSQGTWLWLGGGGPPTPCPLAPEVYCRMLCVPNRERVGTGPLERPFPAPLVPSACFWVAQCRKKTHACEPHHPYLRICSCISPTQPDP